MKLLKSGWNKTKQEPFLEEEIGEYGCIRCGRPALHQWQICSDGNNWRQICFDCDIALNTLVLKWMRHPLAAAVARRYKMEQYVSRDESQRAQSGADEIGDEPR